jgi:hypothetical protein
MKEIEKLVKHYGKDVSNSEMADKIIELINVVNEQQKYIVSLERRINTLEYKNGIYSMSIK